MKGVIVNPRFLDRLNAVCTVFLGLVLLGLTYLSLQSQAFNPPDEGAIVVEIRGDEDLSPAANTPETTSSEEKVS